MGRATQNDGNAGLEGLPAPKKRKTKSTQPDAQVDCANTQVDGADTQVGKPKEHKAKTEPLATSRLSCVSIETCADKVDFQVDLR